MKRGTTFTLATGVGWFTGVNLAFIIGYSTQIFYKMTFTEITGNSLFLSLPGIILMTIAMVMAAWEKPGEE
jgi:predicted ABC-type sugar transport system permease subunit